VVQSDPDLVRRLVAAIDHSLTDALANASDSDIVAATQALSPQTTADAATLQWHDIKQYQTGPKGPMDASVFDEDITLAKDSQHLTSAVKASDLFTNQFLPAR
jgi:hypothetical protein